MEAVTTARTHPMSFRYVGCGRGAEKRDGTAGAATAGPELLKVELELELAYGMPTYLAIPKVLGTLP